MQLYVNSFIVAGYMTKVNSKMTNNVWADPSGYNHTKKDSQGEK